MSKKGLLLPILPLVFILFTSFAYAHDAPNAIHITKNGFEPSSLTINVGDSVIFENEDKDDHWPASDIHPTHGIYPEFDAKEGIKSGYSWEFEFKKAGEWRMHDHLFPQFTGKVIVTGEDKKSFIELIFEFFANLREKFFKQSLYKFNPEVADDSSEIYTNDDELYSYVRKFGPKKTVLKLHNLSSQYGDCHTRAHEAGRMSYEVYKSESFKKCSAECHSGCYHGATEAYFKERGTADLKNDLKVICSSELNSFFSHQCLHGIGHGLTAWANYDLPKALKDCELLETGQYSCWTGVFMENIVGGLAEVSGQEDKNSSAHFTKYLSDNPLFPCNSVDEKYQSSCYFLQTSRMIQLSKGDFKKVAEDCTRAPQIYQRTCFESMGRDVGGYNRNSITGAIATCNFAPEGNLRVGCLIGAVQDYFWDPSGATQAISFCKTLENKDEKESCYTTISERAPQVLASKEDVKSFCSGVEKDYTDLCLTYAR